MESALPRTGAALAIMAMMAARINPPAAGSSHNNTGRSEWRGVWLCGPPRSPWGLVCSLPCESSLTWRESPRVLLNPAVRRT